MKHFVNEEGEVYDHDPATQESAFPNDFHTPFDTREEAERFAATLPDGSPKFKLPREDEAADSLIEDVVEMLTNVAPERITDEDPLADNYRRALKAANAVETYANDGGKGEDIETNIGDLLADMQHLLDFLGVDTTVGELADARRYHYEAEIEGVL